RVDQIMGSRGCFSFPRWRGADMTRIFVARVLPFVSAFLGGVLAYPTVLDAQNGRIRMQSVTAESATIVGADTDRIQLGTQWEGRGGIMNWFAPDGVRRLAV